MDSSAWNLLIAGILVSLLMSVGGLAVVGVLLVRLPSDYFCHSRSRELWIDSHPLIRWAGIVGNNISALWPSSSGWSCPCRGFRARAS